MIEDDLDGIYITSDYGECPECKGRTEKPTLNEREYCIDCDWVEEF